MTDAPTAGNSGGNRCRYCAAPIDDPRPFFCPPPARCQQANSRSTRSANADARAEVLGGLRVDEPSLLDRDPIGNVVDGEQQEMW